MSAQPRVSVVIPVYNRDGLVRESVLSVLEQAFEDAELIVVDDGSDDDPAAGLVEFGERVRVLRRAHAGVSAATNAGIRASRAPFIALHDSDDRMLPGRLQQQWAFLTAHPEVAAVCSDMVVEGDESRSYLAALGFDFEGAESVVLDRPYARLLRQVFMANGATMLRRETFDAVGGFDERLSSAQDWDFWLRVARTQRLACLPALGTWVRRAPGHARLTRSAESLPNKLRVLSGALASAPPLSRSEHRAATRRLSYLTWDYIQTQHTRGRDVRGAAIAEACGARFSGIERWLAGVVERMPARAGRVAARVLGGLLPLLHRELPWQPGRRSGA